MLLCKRLLAWCVFDIESYIFDYCVIVLLLGEINFSWSQITDTIGFISLAQNLWDYYFHCASQVDTVFTNSIGQKISAEVRFLSIYCNARIVVYLKTMFALLVLCQVHLSYGFWCYVFCLFGAMMRFVFHWLTPLPHRGSNGLFVCALPKELVEKLDIDGDGKVSWWEMKEAFRELRNQKRESLKGMLHRASTFKANRRISEAAHDEIVRTQPEMAAFCVCGNKFMDDSVFCRKCGTERPEAALDGDNIESPGSKESATREAQMNTSLPRGAESTPSVSPVISGGV